MCCLTKALKPKLDKKANPKPVHTRNERLLVFAAGDIGIKEYLKKGQSNPHIEKYHAYAREDNDLTKGLTDDVPFCASALCYWLESIGMGSTNSMSARSFLKWGVSTKKDPIPGDIVVYWRGSRTGWKGHVGIIIEYKNGYIYTLGANQNDAVNVTKYKDANVLDIRRSSRMKKPDAKQLKRISDIASAIKKGNKVSLAGSMA